MYAQICQIWLPFYAIPTEILGGFPRQRYLEPDYDDTFPVLACSLFINFFASFEATVETV